MIHARLSPAEALTLARKLTQYATSLDKQKGGRGYAYVHTSTRNNNREWLSLRVEKGMAPPSWDKSKPRPKLNGN